MFSSHLYDDFKLFLLNNGIFTFAGSIIIGLSTALFIKELVTDLMLPILYLVLFKWIKFVKPTFESNISSAYKYTNVRFISFLQNLIIWITALLSTFFILELIFRRIILKTNAIEEESKTTESNTPKHLDSSVTPLPLDNLYGSLF